MIASLSEQWRKQWDYVMSDAVQERLKIIRQRPRGVVACPNLVQRYNDGQISLHLHISGLLLQSAGDQVGQQQRANYCAYFEPLLWRTKLVVGNVNTFELLSDNSAIREGAQGAALAEELRDDMKGVVLVTVIENSESQQFISGIASGVRLQTIEKCLNGFTRPGVEQRWSGPTVTVVRHSLVDRESGECFPIAAVVPMDGIALGEDCHELPSEIVEAASEIM